MNTNHDALREAQTHELKTWPEYFEAIVSGEKTFELRKDDRDFQVGDALLLREWDPITREYTGKSTRRGVSYILRNAWFGIADGYVVLSLSQPMPEAAAQGWKLVPVEPTRDMLNAAIDVDSFKLGDISPLGFRCSPQQLFEKCYASMLSASPAAPEGAKPEDEDETPPSLPPNQYAEFWERLPGHLIDNHEGEELTEELLQRAAADLYAKFPELVASGLKPFGLLLLEERATTRELTRALREATEAPTFMGEPVAVQPPHPQPQAQPSTPMEQYHYLSGKIDGKLEAFKAETQAQGEPDEREAFEWHWYNFYHAGSICARPDGSYVGRNVQNAWEAWQARAQSHREAIAKRDAALVACVEALKLAMHWAGPAMERDMRSPSNSQWMVEKTQAQEDSIYAAITQANEVLGRKEGGV